MTPSAYIRRETMVSIVINTVLSAVFFLAVFGRNGPVRVWGVGAYVFDFAPQGFMIGLMAALVPGILARNARRAGRVDAFPGSSSSGTSSSGASPLPAGIALRALLCAVAGASAGVALSALILLVSGMQQLDWLPALLAKLAFGLALAAVVTPAGLRAELVSRR